MSIYVFLGPTLSLEEASSVLDAVYLPPVSQGDVYRLVSLGGPKAIAIVDGYFNQVPAVWHKEILWAMSEGIPVYGAASMGALRAAELAPFGMRGVGRIFEAYRDGVLPPYGGEPFEDDDEDRAPPLAAGLGDDRGQDAAARQDTQRGRFVRRHHPCAAGRCASTNRDG